jgi:hypothetical protein
VPMPKGENFSCPDPKLPLLKPASQTVSKTARYAEAMADKLWGGADADIEAAARRNLELLGSLGGGDEP